MSTHPLRRETRNESLPTRITIAGIILASLAVEASAAGWIPGYTGPRSSSGHAMAFHPGSGSMVMFGGERPIPRPSNETWLFDGTNWSEGPDAPPGLAPRTLHAMALDTTRGVVVMFGGGTSAGAVNETWEFDGEGWSPGAAAPPALTPRQMHGMAFDSRRGRMVVFGGGAGTSLVDELWEYDGATWSQVTLPLGPTPRSAVGMAYDERRGRIVVYGGYVSSGGGGYQPTSETWEYDGVQWTPGGAAPPGLGARSAAAMAYDATRQALVLFGGFADYGRPDLLADTWIYDGSWHAGPAAPPDLAGRAMTALAWDSARSRLCMFGGYASYRYVADYDDTWELDASGWHQTPSRPLARRWHMMGYDARRRVGVLFGGESAAGHPLDTWEYDGAAWRRGPDAPVGMKPRSSGVMAYDDVRGVMVMHGGVDVSVVPAGDYLSDTWEYDGTSWVAGPAADPAMAPRQASALAFDSRRGVMVLFGGSRGTYPCPECNDTWEFDGTAWRAGAAAPPALVPRYNHAMDFDPVRGVIVMSGGGTLDGPPPYNRPLDDVWEYDGTRWQQVASGHGSPRILHTISYDLRRGKSVVAGGQDAAGNALGDVWEFDGTTWRQGASMPGEMGMRYAQARYYDVSRGRTVYFGGMDEDLATVGDLWEYGSVRDGIVAGRGFGPGSANQVRTFDEAGQASPVDILPYGAGSFGAIGRGGQVSGDDVAEILTGPGPGPTLAPQIRGFRAGGAPLAKVNYYAYATLRYGATAAGLQLDADAWDEIVTGPGSGAVFGPHVRGWNVDGGAVSPLPGVSFFAYGTLRYGVRVEGGDLRGDARAEILSGAGPGEVFGPHVRGFTVDSGPASPLPGLGFFAFGGTSHGVEVEGGDVDGDGVAEIATAPGPDPGARGTAAGFSYDGTGVQALPGFLLAPAATLYGGRVGLGDVTGGLAAELLSAPGPDPAAPASIDLHAYDGAALTIVVPAITAFSPAAYGVNVDAASLGL